jgi:hypothetical protein
VYSREGTAELHLFGGGRNALHSLGDVRLDDPTLDDAAARPEAAVAVATLTLDGYCARHGVERVDFLKIDVEGAELDVLLGAQALLKDRRVGIVQFEVSRPQVESFGHTPDAVFALLAGAGFSAYAFGPGGALMPASTADQMYANYIAVADDAA